MIKDNTREFAVCYVDSGNCVGGYPNNNNNDDKNNNNDSNNTICNIHNDNIDNNIAQDEINRLELLEEALKESIALTVQAELQTRLREEALTVANSKILALESALASPTFRCIECPNLRKQIRVVGQTLTLLRAQRNQHLEDIFDLKMEALSTALSEIDEKAARIEMSSRSEDRRVLSELRQERDELRRRIAQENERRVGMLARLDDEAAFGAIEAVANQNAIGSGQQWQPCSVRSVKTAAKSTNSQLRPRVGLIWPSPCDERLATPDEKHQQPSDPRQQLGIKPRTIHDSSYSPIAAPAGWLRRAGNISTGTTTSSLMADAEGGESPSTSSNESPSGEETSV